MIVGGESVVTGGDEFELLLTTEELFFLQTKYNVTPIPIIATIISRFCSVQNLTNLSLNEFDGVSGNLS